MLCRFNRVDRFYFPLWLHQTLRTIHFLLIIPVIAFGGAADFISCFAACKPLVPHPIPLMPAALEQAQSMESLQQDFSLATIM